MRSENSPEEPKTQTFIERARHRQIIDAAAEVVATVGYGHTTLARIAEQAETSKGVVTYHFSGKDEILREVATEYFSRAWEYMEARILKQETAVGQLKAWIGAEVSYFSEHRTEFLAMSAIVANHRNRDGTPTFGNDSDEEVEGLAEILAAGQRDGQLRSFDPSSVAQIILRGLYGVLAAWAVDPSVDVEAEADVLLDLFAHGIVKGPE